MLIHGGGSFLGVNFFWSEGMTGFLGNHQRGMVSNIVGFSGRSGRSTLKQWSGILFLVRVSEFFPSGLSHTASSSGI